MIYAFQRIRTASEPFSKPVAEHDTRHYPSSLLSRLRLTQPSRICQVNQSKKTTPRAEVNLRSMVIDIETARFSFREIKIRGRARTGRELFSETTSQHTPITSIRARIEQTDYYDSFNYTCHYRRPERSIKIALYFLTNRLRRYCY